MRTVPRSGADFANEALDLPGPDGVVIDDGAEDRSDCRQPRIRILTLGDELVAQVTEQILIAEQVDQLFSL